ncbi:MAG: hypothetical protein ACM3RP_02865 [Chitinophagales bacterium]
MGVQNTFIFSQGAAHRRWVNALPAVVAAALCDTLLIAAAVGGVSLVVLRLSWFRATLSWVGVVGTAALRFPAGPERLAYTLACVSVSWLWFLGLMTAWHLLGALDPHLGLRRWLNRASALIMWFVGWQLLTGLLAG